MKEKEIKQTLGINTRSVQSLTVSELFSGILKLESLGYGDATGQYVTICFGTTRSGQSTIINLLLKNNLVAKWIEDGTNEYCALEPQQKDAIGFYPKIGHGIKSETMVPVGYNYDGGVIYDWPALRYDRPAQHEIMNFWFLDKIFKTAKGIKLINYCSSESLSKIEDFTNYVNQLIDVFGSENLGKIKSVLVFTKAKDPIEKLKDGLLSLLENYLDQGKATITSKFFKQAEVVKMDLIKEVESTVSYYDIQDIKDTLDSISYQKFSQHWNPHSTIKVFLHNSFQNLEKFIIDNTIQSYKKYYVEKNLANILEDTLKVRCVSKDVPTALKEYLDAFNEFIKGSVPNHNLVDERTCTITKIVEFVSNVLGGDSKYLLNFNESIRLYNLSSISYDTISHFIQFLKLNSNNLIYKNKFDKILDSKLCHIKKSKIDPLLINDEIIKLGEGIAYAEDIYDLNKKSEFIKKSIIEHSSNIQILKYGINLLISGGIVKIVDSFLQNTLDSYTKKLLLLGFSAGIIYSIDKVCSISQDLPSDCDSLNIGFADYLMENPINTELLGNKFLYSYND